MLVASAFPSGFGAAHARWLRLITFDPSNSPQPSASKDFDAGKVAHLQVSQPVRTRILNRCSKCRISVSFIVNVGLIWWKGREVLGFLLEMMDGNTSVRLYTRGDAYSQGLLSNR